MFWKTAKQRKILESSYVECPSCGTIDQVSQWNQLAQKTYGDHSPDIRKAAINRRNSFPFQCPTCFKGYSAHSLHFSSEGNSPRSFKTSETT